MRAPTVTTDRPTRVTFVGVGAIGLPMASRLAAAGHVVTALDSSPERREEATRAGLRVEASPTSVAGAEVVLCMVATPRQLSDLALGPEGLLTRMAPGSVLLVMGTVGPGCVGDLVASAPAGVDVLDVPVTGGVARARTGELVLFASGDPAALDRVAPVLAVLGTTRDCGAVAGRGQSYKVVNQLLCSVHIVAGAEALALAERLGLDPAEVLPAVASGAGGSWMLSDRGPRMLQGLDAEVTSTVSIFVKDSDLVAAAAAEAGLEVPLLEAARARFHDAAESGWENRDDSQVVQTYRSMTPDPDER